MSPERLIQSSYSGTMLTWNIILSDDLKATLSAQGANPGDFFTLRAKAHPARLA